MNKIEILTICIMILIIICILLFIVIGDLYHKINILREHVDFMQVNQLELKGEIRAMRDITLDVRVEYAGFK